MDEKTLGPLPNEVDLIISDGRDDAKQSKYGIGDLAREFAITLRTLRFYEDKGLLNPKREGLNRIYTRRDRARLKLVLMGKRVGFSLDEIRAMLDLYDLKDGQSTQLKVALDKFQGQVDILEAQRRDLDQAIDDLKRTVEVIAGLLRQKEAMSA